VTAGLLRRLGMEVSSTDGGARVSGKTDMAGDVARRNGELEPIPEVSATTH
jgi:hypothetical protein